MKSLYQIIKNYTSWVNKQGFEGNTIIIQPGSGFGTGTHPTTRLCLKWLEETI